MQQKYRCLAQQVFEQGKYKIVPIRAEDKNIIMQMRNEQIYHLRQQELLTTEAQEKYFATTIVSLFEQETPNQILFSFLKNDVCIGYGGLVHINWIDKNAEISFIIKPTLEKEYFQECWINFLSMIENVSFIQLNLHKIFTYAFDLRPHLYKAVEAAGFIKEATFKEHCLFEKKFIDIIIHCKINNNAIL
jgi:RimJ/RimL family protein N-acetyltransferase